MSLPQERLIVGRGYAHDANAINFSNAATNYPATNAATYNVNGANQATFHNASALRWALVSNDSAAEILEVEVGTIASGSGVTAQGAAPAAGGPSSRKVYPKSQEWIQLERDGPAVINIKSQTNACLGGLAWYP